MNYRDKLYYYSIIGGDPNVQSLEDAAMQSISTDLRHNQPQGPPRRVPQSPSAASPQGFLPGTYKPPPPIYTAQRSRSGSHTKTDDSQIVSDLWAQQNKAEVVEMKPPSSGRHHGRDDGRKPSSSSLPREGSHGGRSSSGRHRGHRGQGHDSRSKSDLTCSIKSYPVISYLYILCGKSNTVLYVLTFVYRTS